ncbi:unnamed protein product [Prorocentrum cordatum]|uniref:Uncharacterized protein n=1 Tax=Prorocentrum cordatum TaxID=2364126 RepID=A0ABN9RGQ4_9DINO|nr:unnamed protein product [Polarella glacialis]
MLGVRSMGACVAPGAVRLGPDLNQIWNKCGPDLDQIWSGFAGTRRTRRKRGNRRGEEEVGADKRCNKRGETSSQRPSVLHARADIPLAAMVKNSGGNLQAVERHACHFGIMT